MQEGMETQKLLEGQVHENLQSQIEEIKKELNEECTSSEFMTRKQLAKLIHCTRRSILNNPNFSDIECRARRGGKVLYPRNAVYEILLNNGG